MCNFFEVFLLFFSEFVIQIWLQTLTNMFIYIKSIRLRLEYILHMILVFALNALVLFLHIIVAWAYFLKLIFHDLYFKHAYNF